MSVQKILVDGSSLLYRSFYAMPSLTTADGQPSGAVRGFRNSLKALSDRYPKADILVIFDARGDTFRHLQYPSYKANRASMPDELRSQIPLIHRLVRALGLPLLIPPQGDNGAVEADDLIATLARIYAAGKENSLIFSQDKDLAQCVCDRVQLLRGTDDQPMDAAAVQAHYGVAPEQVVDWLALTGDSSDNIPGVPGVGAKTAVRLLQEHGSLDAVISGAEQLKGAVGNRVRAALDELPLFRSLVQLVEDVPLDDYSLETTDPDQSELDALYFELGFSEARSRTGPEDAAEVVQLESLEDLAVWLQEACRDSQVALFFVPDDSQPHSAAVGLGLADGRNRAFLPLTEQLLQQSGGADALRRMLDTLHSGKWILPDAKESLLRTHRMGWALPTGAEDPLLRSYVLNPSAVRQEMEPVALHLGLSLRPRESLVGRGASEVRLSQLPLKDAADLATERAAVALQMEQMLQSRMAEEPALEAVYRQLEMPLVPVLADMEICGVLLDVDQLHLQSLELEEQTGQMQQSAWEMAKQEFNPDSPAQVGKVLFEQLELPVLAKTRGGQPSTAEPVLQELADRGYDLPALILEYRGLRKLLSTYTRKLPLEISAQTGRVHTSYHQRVAATGRLSSSNPNLQNIPIRTAAGRRIRQAFIAPQGSSLMVADYSQIELRVMAHLSCDEAMLAAFAAGRDIHAATANELFGSSDAEARRRAKAVNFGLIYGMSAFGLARQLKIERREAEEYMRIYFSRFPQVQGFIEEIRRSANEKGYVQTLRGRRLYLPEINASNQARRKAAERAAINAPMQGTAADIIKQAMLDVHSWLKEDAKRGRMLLQVHDELVLEVPDTQLEQTGAAVLRLMEQAAELSVPLVVDAGWGKNWDAAKGSVA